jgi:hypothetical protein
MKKANNKQLTVMYDAPKESNLRPKNPVTRELMDTDTVHSEK